MKRKDQLVDEARNLFLEKGIDGMTMRAVAERVGVTATAIYRHFKDKDALIRAVVHVGSERFALYLTRGLQGESPFERLQLTGEGYLDFAFDYPDDYRVMFLSWDRLKMGIYAEMNGTQPSPMLRFFLDRVSECLPASPHQDSDEVMRIALLFWAQVHGMASLYIAGGGEQLFARATFYGMAQEQARTLLSWWQRSLAGGCAAQGREGG